MSIIWYINIRVTSSSKTRGHVDIQVRSNVSLILKFHYQVDLCNGDCVLSVSYKYIFVQTTFRPANVNSLMRIELKSLPRLTL